MKPFGKAFTKVKSLDIKEDAFFTARTTIFLRTIQYLALVTIFLLLHLKLPLKIKLPLQLASI